MQFQFIRKSKNDKTGPIPVTYSPRATCGDACPLKDGACYGETGPVSWNWNKLDKAERGDDWYIMIEKIDKLPAMQLWRHNVLGDLPHNNQWIDGNAVRQLMDANIGKLGFTYTHHDMSIEYNRHIVEYANKKGGFTINLSANDIEHADKLYSLDIGPVAVMVPEHQTENFKTPMGRDVIICPAAFKDEVTCATCKMCQRQRDFIVGLPVHGARKNQIEVYIT